MNQLLADTQRNRRLRDELRRGGGAGGAVAIGDADEADNVHNDDEGLDENDEFSSHQLLLNVVIPAIETSGSKPSLLIELADILRPK